MLVWQKKFTLSPYQHYLTPLMLKLCRKSVDLSPKSFLWMSTQPFTIYLQCLPRGDPGSLCANTRIRLLATHSFGFNHELPTLQILGPSRVKQKPFATLFWITDSFLVWYPLTRHRLSSEPWKLLLHFASKRFILNWIIPISSGVGIHN